MNSSPYILKHALIYFVAFLLCFGPIAGYIYALKKYEPFIMFDQRMPTAAEMQKMNSNTDRNLNVQSSARGIQNGMSEAQCISYRYDALQSSNDRLKEMVREFSVLPVSEDGRIEVSRKILNDLFVEQKETPTLFTDDWNSSTSTEWIPYSNSELGIVSMSIPYNPAWGNRLIKFVPYEIIPSSMNSVTETQINFGKVGAMTKVEWGNDWSIGYLLLVKYQKNAEEIQSEKLGDSFLYRHGSKMETINGHKVVYGMKWMSYPGERMVYEIVGSKFNYQLTHGLYSPYNELEMRKIIESLVVE